MIGVGKGESLKRGILEWLGGDNKEREGKGREGCWSG